MKRLSDILFESRMAELHADIGDELDHHIKNFNAGKIGHDEFGDKVIHAHAKIAKMHDLDVHTASTHVNSYVDNHIKEEVQVDEAKATMCGRCGTKHVPPAQGGKCPALSEGANVRAGNPKAYGNDLAASQTGFNKKPREDDEYHNEPKPKFKAKSLMDRPHDVHIDGKKWKSFNNGHQATAAANTLKAKGKKAVAIARFNEEVEVNELKDTTLKNYIRASSGDVINQQNVANRNGMTDKVRAIIKKRNTGQATAQRKLGEDVDQIDEIGDTSKGRKALGSYIVKASDSRDSNRTTSAYSTGSDYDKQIKTVSKRAMGVRSAVARLTKEGRDACQVCGQTPCNCTSVDESSDKLYGGYDADVLKVKQKAADQEKKNPVDIKKLAARLRAVKLPGDKK